ncbi:MAG: tRNA pseudouridine(54/55) synthase Pus10 [Candidatus Aenigmatarchaeota archaeon]
MDVIENAIELMKRGKICNNCLGRVFANLLSGYSNEERGKFIRNVIAMLYDSGKNIDIDISNFYGIKFRNRKIDASDKKCYICDNFFQEKIFDISNRVVEKLKEYEFSTFLVGTKLSTEMKRREESLLEIINPEYFESIKNEINREIGKIVEKRLNKKMDRNNPEITVLIDLEKETISLNIKSLFIAGEYKKLVRNIPQATWYCQECNGKGCEKCGGRGLLYPNSIQMIIEKPLLKLTKGKKSKIHAEGREDIDVRCLGWRPFVIEIVKPKIRKMDLKKAEKTINKSKKIKVKLLKILEDGKRIIKFLKTEKSDKLYRAEVVFESNIDLNRLKILKGIKNLVVNQQTPLRVLRRRSDIIRRRIVKNIKFKLKGKKTIVLEILASSGLYVKEFITGDGGRTRPSIAEILNNKPTKVILDVIKIYSGFRGMIK